MIPHPAGSTTAHRHWDDVWKTSEGRDAWSKVDPWVAATAAGLSERGVRRVLDLACGVGRHALHFARSGFSCVAIDASETAIEFARAAADEEGLDIDLRVGRMRHLPFADGHFDYVLAYNAIYHGDRDDVRATVREIHRVLRPGGTYQVTMLSRRNKGFGVGDLISEGTFIQPGAADDKVHPHFYCDAADLLALNRPAEPLSVYDGEHAAPGSFHWHCVFELPGESGSGGVR